MKKKTKPTLTVTYQSVCCAKTKTKMQVNFLVLLKQVSKKFGGTPKSHSAQQLSNVGYVAGYYDEAVRQRVYRSIGAEHPIFGNKKITAEKAFRIGRQKQTRKR